MHIIEEGGANANVLDNDDYVAPDDLDIGLEEDEKENVDPEEEIEVLHNIDDNTNNCQYYIHKKVPKILLIPDKLCQIHKYEQDYSCERTNLSNYFEEKEKRELLAANILDITRMYDDRMKAFRKNILKAPQSDMCIQYFQDKTEFGVSILIF